MTKPILEKEKYKMNGCLHFFDTKTKIKTKTVFKNKIYICSKCGYYNSAILINK